MKLLRWTLAGASFYVIYKYSIGNKAKGTDVFETPETDGPDDDAGAAVARPKKPTPKRPRRT